MIFVTLPKITALVQNAQGSDEEDDLEAPGAPAAAVYQSHSGSIVETLEDLKAKAESQLADFFSRFSGRWKLR